MRIDKLIEERLATSRKEMKRLFQQGKSWWISKLNGTHRKCRQSIA